MTTTPVEVKFRISLRTKVIASFVALAAAIAFGGWVAYGQYQTNKRESAYINSLRELFPGDATLRMDSKRAEILASGYDDCDTISERGMSDARMSTAGGLFDIGTVSDYNAMLKRALDHLCPQYKTPAYK